jgi:hypothetical protein
MLFHAPAVDYPGHMDGCLALFTVLAEQIFSPFIVPERATLYIKGRCLATGAVQGEKEVYLSDQFIRERMFPEII